MALTVWKYEIPIADEFTLDLPDNAELLTVQVQPMQGVMVWALVNPEAPKRRRTFHLAGTGHPMEYKPHDLRFIGSFQLDGGALVFHLFELV
jgi:hypothetical protein